MATERHINSFLRGSPSTVGTYSLDMGYSQSGRLVEKERWIDDNRLHTVASALRGPLDLLLHSDLPSVDGVPQSLKPIVTVKTTYFESAIEDYFTNRVPEDEAYFYHGDHLGGANWITDASGLPVQHLQLYYHARFSSTRSTGACTTFGERYVDQHTSGYQRSTTKDGAATHKAPLRGPLDLVPFTGKERDAETGYSYFGARYYDSDLSGLFLSVDPMSDKYPSISPYAYCVLNPIKLVDPDGREIDDYFSESGKYLGSDNAETNYVRIINESTWNILKKDENGLIEHEVGFTASMSFSYAGSRNMSIDAQLSVYQHYNPTNNNLENLDNKGVSYGMRSHFVPDANPVIQIRLEGNRKGIKVCDNADEIKNLFAHEKGHIDHYYRIGHAEYQSTSYEERENCT